ncbi:MAG: hypothetical protein KME43_11370 [Myxacorys chilensis ATA2-1-KO14]|jgi:hypothetical protein|nr:hypothetical protein [Myxacorys chilensis ATA2-1-KO14]
MTETQPVFTITKKESGFYSHSSRYYAKSRGIRGEAIFNESKGFAQIGDKVYFDEGVAKKT